MSLYKVEDHHIGTHASHCCVLHGQCKYGSFVCPVILGTVKQTRICESCGRDGIKDLQDTRLTKAKLKSKDDIVRDLSRKIVYYQEKLMQLDFEVMDVRKTLDEIQELKEKYDK